MKKTTMIITTVMLLLIATLIPVKNVGLAAKLSDIPQQYKEEVDFLVSKKIITGYPDGTFGPSDNVTREAAVTMIGRALGLDGTKRKTKFADVDQNSYGSGYIASAVEAGIISGYTDGTFRPRANMTRGAMAYMLQRAFDLKGKGDTVFRDVLPTTNKSLYEAVDALAENGITNGYPDDRTFRPNNTITRVAYSLLVARGLDESFKVKFSNEPLYERYVNVETSLNIRTDPGETNNSIGKLTNGTKVLVYSEHGKWLFVKAGSLIGYIHNDYVVEIQQIEDDNKPEDPKPELPNNKQRYIAIDAGHGGKDSGSLGNGLLEKEINYNVAKRVEALLQKQNIKVLMTRKNDEYVSLEDRVAIATKAKVDTLVSIHTNSFTDPKANGTETYYNLRTASTKADDSKQLATFIQNRLHKALGTTNRGVKQANFAVIRTTFPSALIELAFISNKNDAEKLASDKYRQLAAEAIAAGIIDYYNWKEKQPKAYDGNNESEDRQEASLMK